MGRNFGNPLTNMFMSNMFGHNLMPQRDDGQSMHEAMIQRMRSANFMNLQTNQFANNSLFKQLGVSGSPYAGIAGGMLGSPNGMLANMMSPALGGNPMAASMQLYAGLTGSNTMGAFGGMHNISGGGAQSVMNALSSNFYKGKQDYEGPEGYQQQVQKESREFLRSRMSEGAEGKKYLRGLGFTGTDAEISEKIDKYDITSDEESAKLRNRSLAKGMQARKFGAALDDLEDTKDRSAGDIRKAHDDFKDNVTREYNLTADQLKDVTGKDGKINTGKMRDLLSRSTQQDRLEGLNVSAAEAKAGGGRLTAINFENTRGFKLEDFTSGFNKAAELRMLGDSATRRTSPAAAMRGFSEHSGGAMDAARSLFGDKSGGELVKEMSDLAGGSGIDMSSREGAGEMEELLRKAKATARVAGVSIKTMLGIIQSSKELAQNNPQLQHMNEGATTHLALNAITKAAAQGSRMTSQDFRAEGGSQGMAAANIQESMRFTQSNMGQARSAILAAFHGDPEKYKAVKAILARHTTERELNDTGLEEIAKATGRSRSDLLGMSQDKTLAAEGLKIEDVAKEVSGATQESAYKSFFEGSTMDRKSIEADYAKHMASGGTELDFVNGQILSRSDVTGVRKKMLASTGGYRQSILAGLRDSGLTDDEKAAHTDRVNQSAKDDAEISKKYAAANAPIITQMVSALAEGKSFKGTTHALASIFSTENVADQARKTKLEAAQASGKGLADILGKTKGNEQAIGAGAVGEINKLTGSIKGLIGTDEGKNIKDIDEGELRNLLDVGKTLDLKNKDEAQARLNDLEKQANSGKINAQSNPNEMKAMRALQTMRSLNGLNSDKALESMQQGTVGGVTAGIYQGYQGNVGQAKLKEITDTTISRLDTDLSKDPKLAAQLAELRKQYGEGKAGTSKMLDAYEAGSGVFADTKDARYKGIRNKLGEAQERISSETDKAMSNGTVNPEDKYKTDMLKAFEGLTKAINSGGGFTDLLSNLATALKG